MTAQALSEQERYRSNKVYIGIDPGLGGAVAVLDEHGNYVEVFDMPVMANGKGKSTVKQQVNPVALYDRLIPYAGAMAVVESVNAMPGQGVASMFSLGDSFGCIRAITAAIEISTEFVTPQAWKKFYKISAPKKDAKEIARGKAIALYPTAPLSRKSDADRAEALLMARYGCCLMNMEII